MAKARYLSLKDHVYAHITDLINAGKLGEFEHVSEQSIADALSVSRTPVPVSYTHLTLPTTPYV